MKEALSVSYFVVPEKCLLVSGLLKSQCQSGPLSISVINEEILEKRLVRSRVMPASSDHSFTYYTFLYVIK